MKSLIIIASFVLIAANANAQCYFVWGSTACLTEEQAQQIEQQKQTQDQLDEIQQQNEDLQNTINQLQNQIQIQDDGQ